MKMNKKMIAAVMAMSLAATGLTACGGSGNSAKGTSSDETYTVTMAYIGDKKKRRHRQNRGENQ